MTVITPRVSQNQGLHDRVVSYIQSHLDSLKYDIYTNPGSEQNWHIRGQFPDVLVTPKGSKSVQFVLEVETSDTVTADEARNQWKEYATLPGTFYLIVPQESLELAKIICSAQGISAKFGYFMINGLGQVTNVQYL
jgi:hypothetical protein